MRPALRARAAQQDGLFTRRQAVEAGHTEREIRTATRSGGPWVTIRRGVYAERDLWETVDGYDGPALLRDRAAHLIMRQDHLMSHDSAARAHGLAFLRPATELSHVTRFGVGGTRTEHGVKHHMTRLGLLNTATIAGMPVTGLARTAVDIGREHGWVSGTVACDAAIELGLDRADLEAELVPMWCWPDVTQARTAVALCRPGAETPGETLLRLLVLELEIGEPDPQFPVMIRSGVAWTDLRVGCHIFEFDGRVKYRRPDQGGVSDRPVEDVLWDERTRQSEICAEGLGMSRAVWDDLLGAPRDRTLERLGREYAVTSARFGDVLSERLARSAAEIRARSPRRARGHRRRS
jgi:hypothetical protein